jgi:hypothetical protein
MPAIALAKLIAKINRNDNDPQKIVNALRQFSDEVDGVIKFFDPGGGHGQGWKINEFTGTIPLNSHGQRNLPAAVADLLKALATVVFD